MPLWNEIEGKTLNGLPLRTLLRSEGRTAWFATEEAGQPAVVSLFEALNDEDAVEDRLKAAAHLQHPNLLAIRTTGRGRLDDEPLIYAVMEPFDQTLAEILAVRTLTPDETREVADSLLRGLEAVEGAGLSHGHVDATGVLGVGDSIKLRSDCLRPHTSQSDAPALAALIYHAMTGRRLGSERDAMHLPAPFATLVRAGAGPNGSLAAMRRVLDGPATATGVPPASPIIAGPTVTAAEPPATPSVKPAASAPAPPSRPILRTEPEARPRRRGITIAAIAIMAIVLGIFWHSMTRRPTGRTPIIGEAPAAPAPATPQTTTPSGAPPAAAPVGNGAAGNVRSPRPVPPTSGTPAATVSHEGGERSQWRVIVYTYDQQDVAQHKATQLAAKFPQFEPQVFTPTGHAPFLVSLGGGMSRHDAFMRREAAKSAGLPPDTYMQNYRK